MIAERDRIIEKINSLLNEGKVKKDDQTKKLVE